MKNVQLVLTSRSKTRTVTPSVSPVPTPEDLPGYYRVENQNREELLVRKREYNLLLRRLQDLNRKINTQKGDVRKQTRQEITALRGEMKSLLVKIGSYTHTEEALGFKEDGNGF